MPKCIATEPDRVLQACNLTTNKVTHGAKRFDLRKKYRFGSSIESASLIARMGRFTLRWVSSILGAHAGEAHMTSYVQSLFAKYPPILSAKDVADALQLNSKTVYDYLQSGELPAYQVGTRWVIVRDEVVASIERRSNHHSHEGVTEVGASGTARSK